MITLDQSELIVAEGKVAMPVQDAVSDLMGKAPSLLHGMEVIVNEDSLLLRNPQRLQIGGFDGLPDSRWPFKKELRADLDATDRLADHTVFAGAVVLRIKLLKSENCIEVKRWLRVS